MDYVEPGVEALRAAYEKQIELLNAGTIGDVIDCGTGSDKATRGDWESEEAVLAHFREIDFPARVMAEEHGEVNIVENPIYLVVLDGIDGSSGLVANNRTRAGTMLSIADNLDPKYEDFVFGGITEFVSDMIMYGVKGGGTHILENLPSRAAPRALHAMREVSFGKGLRVHVDNQRFWGAYAQGITSGMDTINSVTQQSFIDPLESIADLSGASSTCSMTVDLLLGRVDAVGGVIGKGCYEPPAEQVMIRELGGVMFDLQKGDIGSYKWSDTRGEIKPLLRASSRRLGNEMKHYLGSIRV